MDWCALDIRKASILKKEVDLALLQLQQAEGDSKRTASLMSAFSRRVDEIEEFRYQYDSDERAILFEKERLRLRKVLQDATVVPSTPAPPSAASMKKKKQQSEVDGATLTGPVKHISFSKTPLRKKTSGAGGSGNIDMSAVSSTKAPAKIYDWEDEGKASGADRGMISIDGNVFAPCREPGMYVAAREELDPNANEEYIDMQIVLSKHEVTLLASRMHKSSDPQIGHFKNQISSGSVFHSTPYVDQSKLLKDLYRPTQPSKWTAESDLRPNSKR